MARWRGPLRPHHENRRAFALAFAGGGFFSPIASPIASNCQGRRPRRRWRCHERDSESGPAVILTRGRVPIPADRSTHAGSRPAPAENESPAGVRLQTGGAVSSPCSREQGLMDAKASQVGCRWGNSRPCMGAERPKGLHKAAHSSRVGRCSFCRRSRRRSGARSQCTTLHRRRCQALSARHAGPRSITSRKPAGSCSHSEQGNSRPRASRRGWPSSPSWQEHPRGTQPSHR